MKVHERNAEGAVSLAGEVMESHSGSRPWAETCQTVSCQSSNDCRGTSPAQAAPRAGVRGFPALCAFQRLVPALPFSTKL